MCYSLIISNVFTRQGNKTFTLRWDKKNAIDWYDIFRFISKKSGFNEECHTVKIGKYFIKYEKISSIPKFNLEDYVYYNSNGHMTKTGLLNTGIDNTAIFEHNVMYNW